MPPVGSVRRVIRFEIDGQEFNTAVTSATLKPEAETTQIRTLAPDGVSTDASPAVWSLDVEYNVAYSVDSFYRFLIAQAGAEALFEYEPNPVREPGVIVSGVVLVTAGDAGGAVGDVDSGKITLPIVGVPVFTDPPAAP